MEKKKKKSDITSTKLPNIFRYIQPICLPSGGLINRDFTGSLPVVLGWGTTYYGGEEVNILRGVALPVWTRSDCDQAYFQPITQVFLCAGFADGGRDACQGDSGGPLVLYDEIEQRWVLLGIVSFGNRYVIILYSLLMKLLKSRYFRQRCEDAYL